MLTNLLEEAKTGRTDHEIAIHIEGPSRILIESEKFVLLPSVSPIVPGHCMIVPKFESFGFNHAARDSEFGVFFESVASRNMFRSGYSVLEHGIIAPDRYAGTVTHAHLHIIPFQEELMTSLKARCKEIAEFESNNFVPVDQVTDIRIGPDQAYSYIFGQSAGRTPFCTTGKSIPSHVIRNVAVDAGLDCARNWRSLGYWQRFRDTISDFNRKNKLPQR